MQHYVFGNRKLDFFYGVVSAVNLKEACSQAVERFNVTQSDREHLFVNEINNGPNYDYQARAREILLERHHLTPFDEIQAFMDKLDNDLLRQEINREYSYAIPTYETLDAIHEYGPLLEIGAGTGYWAKMITENGQDIIATDEIKSGTENRWVQRIGRHHAVETIDGVEAVKKYPCRSVLMVWPTQHTDLAANVLEAMSVGSFLLMVHDRVGGMIGTPAMHTVLKRSFSFIDRIPLPHYPFFDDVFKTYHKDRD